MVFIDASPCLTDVSSSGVQFHLTKKPEDFESGRDICLSMEMEAASIYNDAENTAVQELLRKSLEDGQYAYIGLVDFSNSPPEEANDPDRFHWISDNDNDTLPLSYGTEFSTFPWGSGQPNEVYEQVCVQ